MYRSQRTDILKTIQDVCAKEFVKQDSTGIFMPNYLREIELKLKKTVRQTYPIEHVRIWKVTIM